MLAPMRQLRLKRSDSAATKVANPARFSQNRAMPVRTPLAKPSTTFSLPQAPVAATPMAYVREIEAVYQRAGLSPASALKLAQITPAQLKKTDAKITARQMEVLSGAAMQELDDEALGAFSRRLPWGSYGMLARASLGAPDLGMALKRWCRHHALLTHDILLKVVTSGDSTAIVLEERGVLARHGQGAREFCLVHVLRNIHGLACWYIDSRIPLQSAHFPFAQPPHGEAYALMFPGAIRFDAVQAELRFDSRYLALPLRRDEKALQQMLQRALPLTVRPYRRDRLLVQQVRQALASSEVLSHNADTLAAALNMSPRSLHRQLQEEGASLQQLKDQVRSQKAKDLLQRTTQPVKQVAAASGFRNEKSFIRAFRTWVGCTPTDFRRSVD
jgi:AraC-like DNA-binding protein